MFLVSRYESKMMDTDVMEPLFICLSLETLATKTDSSLDYVKDQYEKLPEDSSSFLIGKSMVDAYKVDILECFD